MQLWAPGATYEEKNISNKNIRTIFWGGESFFLIPGGPGDPQQFFHFFIFLNIPRGSLGIPGDASGSAGISKESWGVWGLEALYGNHEYWGTLGILTDPRGSSGILRGSLRVPAGILWNP